MTGKEIVLQIMEDRGVTQAQLGKRLGLNRGAVWARLNTDVTKDMMLTIFNEMANALDYEVVLRPKNERYVGGKEYVLEQAVPEKKEEESENED